MQCIDCNAMTAIRWLQWDDCNARNEYYAMKSIQYNLIQCNEYNAFFVINVYRIHCIEYYAYNNIHIALCIEWYA